VTRTILVSAILTTAITFAVPAHATLLMRTFVSSAGSDANPCTVAQPCATFAHAVSVTAANGIIAALDPGKYGPVTITRPITINGNGWAAVTAPAQGNGFTINASPRDNIVLLGLEIDGAGAAFNGIVLNLALSLTVDNCVLQNFVSSGASVPANGNGILIQPAFGVINFSVTNTIASNNSSAGIAYLPLTIPGAGAGEPSPQVNGVIDRFNADSNALAGIYLDTTASPPGSSATVAVSNSVLSNSSGYGIFANGTGSPPNLELLMDNDEVNNNTGGIAVNTAKALLGRSSVVGNGTGVVNGTANTGSNTFYTYQDNQIDFNGTDISGGLNTAKVLR
jgi:hypothetical protein